MTKIEHLHLAAFAAAPGTYLLDRERGQKEARMIPVIGYLHIQSGIAFPITPISGGGLTLGRVLVTPDGLVSDPAFGVVCKNPAEWMVLSGTDAYWEREPETKPLVLDEAAFLGKSAATEADGKPGSDFAETDARGRDHPTRIPDKPAAPIKPDRIFKSNSYWKFQRDPKKHDNAWDCVWMIPGGSPVPPEKGSPYLKITGEEFKGFKKAGWPEADPRQDPAAGKAKPAADDDDDIL